MHWAGQRTAAHSVQEVDDELLALNILFKSRGVTVAGEDSVKVESDDPDDSAEPGKE